MFGTSSINPEPTVAEVESAGFVDVPQEQWFAHPILVNARMNSSRNTLEWPRATHLQRKYLREITLVAQGGAVSARIFSPFNFDLFVDGGFRPDQQAPILGEVADGERFYARASSNGLRTLGAYTAVTTDGVRYYSQWLNGAWVEIGQRGFLFARDDPTTHFLEIPKDQLEEYQSTGTISGVGLDIGDQEEALPQPAVTQSVFTQPVFTQPVPSDHADVLVETPETVSESYVPFAPRQTSISFKREVSTPAISSVSIPPGNGVHRERRLRREPGALADVELGHEKVEAAFQHGIASALASVAHRGQMDKVGAAFVDHPARVAEQFDWLEESILHCAAWLHHTIESGYLTQQDLLDAGIRPEVVDVVAVLTHASGLSDSEYYARIRTNPLARAVKLAEIADNSASWRTRRLDASVQSALLKKYSAARAALGVTSNELPR